LSIKTNIFFSNENEWREKMQSQRHVNNTATTRHVAREALVNLTGWSTEYMVTHIGLIVTNPLLYRGVNNFTEKYLLSPLGLIGRGTIWVGRGLLAVSDLETRPENIAQVLEQAGFDLVALAAVQAVYLTGSKLAGHSNLLIERTFVDTVVASAVSSLLRNTFGSRSSFWHRSAQMEEPQRGNEHTPLLPSAPSL
jgi:hypothetical protein